GGLYDVTGSTLVTQTGNVRFTGTVQHVGALTIADQVGDFRPQNTSLVPLDALTITPGATLTGTASFAVSGPFTWTGGTLQGVTGQANGGGSISGTGNKSLDGATLINPGTITWSTGNVVVQNGGGLVNGPGATFGSASNTNTITLNNGSLSGFGTIN